MKRWALSVGVGLLVVCGSFAESPAKSPKGKLLLVVAATDFSTEQYQSIRQGLEKSGYEITVASSKKQTTGVPEYKLDADVLLSDVENLKPYLGIIFCGGPGIVEYQGLSALSNSDKPKPIVWKLVGEALEDKKVVGAICQAPAFVLAPTGALKGKRVAGWGGKEERDAFRKAGAIYSGSNLEVDRNVITAKNEGLKLFVQALQKACGSQSQVQPTTTTTTTTTNRVATAVQFASRLENEVLLELNLVRADPPKYAEFLSQYRKEFINTFDRRGKGNTTIRTTEGVKAVDEAIEYLGKAKALLPLKASGGLSLAAKDHVADTGRKGSMGHDGADGSTMEQRMARYGKWEDAAGENISYGMDTARDIVFQLIIDDGVPSRGHRSNIFATGFHTVGVAFGVHKTCRYMCVMDFAGGFRDGPMAVGDSKTGKP